MVPLSECSVCVPIYIYIYIYIYMYICISERWDYSAVMKVFWIWRTWSNVWGRRKPFEQRGPPYNVDLYSIALIFAPSHLFLEPPRPFALLKFQRFKRCDHFILSLDPMIYVKTVFNGASFKSQMCDSANHCRNIPMTLEEQSSHIRVFRTMI